MVEKPNAWAKTIKAAEGLSDLKKLQLEYWQAFCDHAFAKADFKKTFSQRKAAAQHWYTLSVGSSAYYLSFTVNTQKKRIGAEIYITDNKEVYEKFLEKKTEIESDMGMELEWKTASKDCRIIAFKAGDIKKGIEAWTEYLEWYCNMAYKLRKITQKYGI